jgi:hypothetical protein
MFAATAYADRQYCLLKSQVERLNRVAHELMFDTQMLRDIL